MMGITFVIVSYGHNVVNLTGIENIKIFLKMNKEALLKDAHTKQIL